MALAAGAFSLISATNPRRPAAVDQARLEQADADPANWMTHGRTFNEDRYSPLGAINRQNVSKLGVAWSYEMRESRGVEATPIVVDGVMYITSAWSIVHAIDATNGKELWVYDPEVPRITGTKACCDAISRGVTVWNGKVYVATLDGRLVAIDARNGRKVWEQVTLDRSKPYTITGAPRAARGLIYIGNSGSEYGVRGFVSAYDAETGKLRWRFYITPNPKGPDGAASDSVRDRALETWNTAAGEWLRSGGGGASWDALVFDKETNTLWIGTGNGGPWNRELRSPSIPGRNNDNLYLSSVLGVDPDTGAYKCHYQETPGETWDFTATQPMILTTLKIGGSDRRVLLHAPKNGFFYVIDRTNCGLISAKPFVPVSWATGVDPKSGRPIENPEARFQSAPFLVSPSGWGGHNWHPMSMSRQTGLVYIPVRDAPVHYAADPAFVHREGSYNTGTAYTAFPEGPAAREMIRKLLKGYLLAWDPVQQKEAWRVPLPGIDNGGTLATAGGLVFQGTVDGRLRAYNARTGAILWDIDNGAPAFGGPISYSVKGRQYLAVTASFGTPAYLTGAILSTKVGDMRKSRVNVYRLGGAPIPKRPVVENPTPEPPVIAASEEMLQAGSLNYSHYCLGCHGMSAVSGGATPDLRRTPYLQDGESFRAVVHGALATSGMPNFSAWLKDADVEAIRAYIAGRARDAFQEEQKRKHAPVK
ncbi:PQQ-dependent dehydrogenase, methanol/ethanol family [Sphingobium subterraneum]|uniref:Quinohemoprotein ethanol dehydrogenase n=1 Tax=Sphingobium subterraneum TaxID=627688 RepID=A0A841IWS6_9SPHN|nr:PQQ-dependent dehydrogenase, methanol/ethanol family [Sphingobium subterraneum]MBB6122730.1 quinohemoprotein ethanol dehydrogenase [Sphingobium subterraneum]